MLCYAMLCCAMLWYALHCNAVLCYAILCWLMLSYSMLCFAVLYSLCAPCFTPYSTAGFSVDTGNDYISICSKNKSIYPVNITTGTYPGFPTDLQAQWMALMTKADGSTIITENIYKDRFTHISELSRFGAHIELDGNSAFIKGNDLLKGAPVMSTDIRASASLILSALSAKGKSSISRIYHIDRGYEKIENKLSKLDANIIRIQE